MRNNKRLSPYCPVLGKQTLRRKNTADEGEGERLMGAVLMTGSGSPSWGGGIEQSSEWSQ